MASPLGSLVVSLEANMAKFIDEMSKASYQADKGTKQIKSSIDGLRSSITSLLELAGGAYVLNRLWEGFKGIVEADRDLLHLAERLGTTAGQLSELQYAAKRSGVDLESFNTGITRFEKNLSAAALANEQADTSILGVGESSNKAAQALRELGLNAGVMAQLPLKDQLFAIAQRLDQLPSETDKVRVGFDLFGRGAANLITMLKQGPEAIQAFIDRGKQLGVVIGDDMAARGASSARALGELKAALQGLGNTAVDLAAPGITKMVDGLTAKIVAARESGTAVNFLNGIMRDLNKVLDEPGLNAIRNGLIGFRIAGLGGAAAGAVAGVAGLRLELQQLANIGNNPFLMALLGVMVAPGGLYGKLIGAGVGGGYGLYRWSMKNAKEYEESEEYQHEYGFEGYETPGDNPTLAEAARKAEQRKRLTTPIPGLYQAMTRAKPSSGGGKGGDLTAAENALQSFIDRMNELTAKGSGDSMAALSAWYQKETDNLQKLTAKMGESAEARTALDNAYWSQAGKLAEDFYLLMAKESGDAYVEIAAQYDKDLKKYQGIAGAKEQLDWIRQQKTFEAQQKIEQETQDLHKSNLSAISQASPYLTDQLAIERQLLNVEIQRGQAELELKLSKMQISQEAKDQLRAEQALADQARRYAQDRKEWQTQGWAGGLKIGATELSNTASSWEAEQIASFIKSAPKDLSTTMAQNFVDTLQGKKTDFETLGYSMAQSMIQKMYEGLLNRIIPALADGVANIFTNAGGGSGGGGLGGWLSSLFGGGDKFSGYGVTGADAQGNAYYHGVHAFAKGGLVHRPTLFAMANGLGLMGEAGPEAVMPLTRTAGGDLGVKTVGGAGGGTPTVLTINIINQGQPVSAKGQMNSNGELDLYIEQVVANGLSKPGLISKTMTQTYSISPGGKR